MVKVYLAGGMHSEWRQLVKLHGDNVLYLDPCKHNYNNPSLYSLWDASAVDECDILLAYLEADNPSGYGLVAEIGRASGQGKLIIFVDEKTALGNVEAKYLPIVREWSDIVVDTLKEGIDHLTRFLQIYA